MVFLFLLFDILFLENFHCIHPVLFSLFLDENDFGVGPLADDREHGEIFESDLTIVHY